MVTPIWIVFGLVVAYLIFDLLFGDKLRKARKERNEERAGRLLTPAEFEERRSRNFGSPGDSRPGWAPGPNHNNPNQKG